MFITKKNRVCLIAAIISSILVPAIASAQAFRNPPQDARAAGMGNAFTARADNASAVYYNPAGIAFLESPLAVTGNLSIIDPRYKNTTQGFRSEKQDFYVPDGFIATNLFNKYLSFGYGAFSEFGLGNRYPKDSPAAPLAYMSSLQTVDNRFTWALRPPKPLDWVAIAGGFDLLYGQTRTKSTVDFGALTGSPTGQIGRTRFTGDGHAFGWHLAGLIKAKKMHSAGITFASQMDIDERGHFRLAGIPSSVAPVPELSFPAKTKFVLPARITAGYNFKPVDWFQVGCDLTWLKFNKFKNVAIDIEDPTGFMPGQVINFDFNNSWIWALGTELGPFKGFSFRTGWCYIQTPVPGSAFNSMIPDSDRNVATVGLGYQYKNISLDLCYAAIIVNKRKVNNSVGYPFTSINGTWKGFINQILLGASYAL
ncbi:MAG: outer membrane protein transport protein [bacterium]